MELKKRIDEILETSVKTGSQIGEGCLVFKDGRELYSGCAGFADKAAGKPFARDTLCRLFSCTKPVTSAAVMMLIDKGIVSPDDPVSKFFPEYADLKYVADNDKDIVLPCDKELKLVHLLSMTSGLPYAGDWGASVRGSAEMFGEIIHGQETGSELTTSEICRRAAKIPLMFKPGEHWDYGISADILGGVIEAATGMRFGEFLKDNIFDPLGMNDTAFYVPESKLDRFAALYSWSDSGLKEDHGNYLGLTDFKAPPAFESGGAGLVSTLNDYSRFARCLANGGEFEGVRLFSHKTFEYMTSPQLGEAQRADMWERLGGYSYGNLMRIMLEPEKSESRTAEGEFGWDGWTGTFFAGDYKNRIAIIHFTQICGAGFTHEARDVCRAVYEFVKQDI